MQGYRGNAQDFYESRAMESLLPCILYTAPDADSTVGASLSADGLQLGPLPVQVGAWGSCMSYLVPWLVLYMHLHVHTPLWFNGNLTSAPHVTLVLMQTFIVGACGQAWVLSPALGSSRI